MDEIAEGIRRITLPLPSRPKRAHCYDLFGADLHPSARRFAVVETLSHLERLVVEGRAACGGGSGTVSYTQR